MENTGPHHVAIIMDGNGRWAAACGRPRLFGHEAGAATAKKIIETAIEQGVRVLTLYAFSHENWQRPIPEVHGLITLLERYLSEERTELLAQGVRVRILGETERFPAKLQTAIERLVEESAQGRRLDLNIALSYSARRELVRAARRIAQQALDGTCLVESIDELVMEKALDTHGAPDPDLLIRTGGEKRLSNFLLWQLAYTELYLTDTLWPDFNVDEFATALNDYHHRQRRFGRTPDQIEEEGGRKESEHSR